MFDKNRECLSYDEFKTYLSGFLSEQNLDELVKHFELDVHVMNCERCGNIYKDLAKMIFACGGDQEKIFKSFDEYWNNNVDSLGTKKTGSR